MKRIIQIPLFIMLMITACSGSNKEIAHPPTAAGMPKATATPDDNEDPAQRLSTSVNPEEIVTAYPGAANLDDKVVTAVPTGIVEPTGSPGTYPGPVETAEEMLTEHPLGPVEPDSSIGDDSRSTVPQGGTLSSSYKVINIFPHDRESFIQGLVVDDNPDTLLEGSGLWGKSSLRRVDLETGEVTQYLPLPDHYFGEGITVFDDRIIQLTWKSGVGLVYDSDSFDLLEEFGYPHEGWGITHDGQQLIVSDGTATIHFWDPETYQETRQIFVKDEFGPVTQLNELEYVDGEIFANVWQSNIIVRIDPDSGLVIGQIDMTGLLGQDDQVGTEGVLNGIAYDSVAERLFVTGKRWPTLYEIELVLVDAPE